MIEDFGKSNDPLILDGVQMATHAETERRIGPNSGHLLEDGHVARASTLILEYVKSVEETASYGEARDGETLGCSVRFGSSIDLGFVHPFDDST
jgi:hypothetical protein